MKVGDYVRTPYGIRKVKDIRIKDNYLDDGFYVEDRFIVCGHKAMQEVKSSPNIIDLIEVGDYVNGHKVFDKAPGCVYIENIENKINHIPITRDNLGTVLTKELFESMEYKIGE